MAHLLKRLAQEHPVETPVFGEVQLAVEVALHYGNAVGDAAPDLFGVDLDALHDGARILKLFQERTVAAPQIEHPLAG